MKELTDKEFEDVLNEMYPAVNICGMTYSAGYALRQIDEIAFNMAKSDYEDTLEDDEPEPEEET